jgi:hypothetical protein
MIHVYCNNCPMLMGGKMTLSRHLFPLNITRIEIRSFTMLDFTILTLNMTVLNALERP